LPPSLVISAEKLRQKNLKQKSISQNSPQHAAMKIILTAIILSGEMNQPVLQASK